MSLKLVNDSLGHDAGDRFLRGIAPRLAAAVGPHELAARIGGDEFALFLVGVWDDAELGARLATARRLAR